jgi:tripartite-type tricarboxylate transporter receptor subunit TctC
MKRTTCWLSVGLVLWFAPDALGQDAFFKGKTIRIIVGVSAGGGYDTYSRLVARHLGKHIPGTPTVIVDNMPGAASLIAANHVYKVARPDGLTIGHFLGGLFMQQLLEKPGIEFDARKFEYIGVPAQDHFVIALSRAAGISSAEQWMASKRIVKIGGVGTGSPTDDIPRILVATIGLPVQLVTGYKGTAEVRLAFNSGEVNGVCNAWESLRATWRKELDAGDVNLVLQASGRSHPEMAKVPLAISFARSDEARRLIEVAVHSVPPTARPYVLPPGTPKERVEILRKAFTDTMKDPELLAEAQKAKLDINPADGRELERSVKDLFALEPALVSRLKEILR